MKQVNKFDGADDLYLTPKRIVKVSVTTSKGKAKEPRSLFKKRRIISSKRRKSTAVHYP